MSNTQTFTIISETPDGHTSREVNHFDLAVCFEWIRLNCAGTGHHGVYAGGVQVGWADWSRQGFTTHTN